MTTITLVVKQLKVYRFRNQYDKITILFDGPPTDSSHNQYPKMIAFTEYGKGIDYVKNVFGITDFDVIDI